MDSLKERLKSNKYTYMIYKLIGTMYYKLHDGVKKKRMAYAMKKNATKTIAQLQDILAGTGFFFFFDMGTLLGIIRDGKLMKYDLDIDIGVKIESTDEKQKLRKILIDNGCTITFAYEVDEIGIVEESYKLNGIKFDINYYSASGGKDTCYLLYHEPHSALTRLNVVQLTCNEIRQTKDVLFQEIKVSVPIDAEKYLAERYGGNWTIPDKNYVYWKGPSALPIDNLGDQIKY